MEKIKEVVANTSSIIFIAKLRIFELAKNVFGNILIPTQVIDELFDKESSENIYIKKELGFLGIECLILKEKKTENMLFLNLGLSFPPKATIVKPSKSTTGTFSKSITLAYFKISNIVL